MGKSKIMANISQIISEKPSSTKKLGRTFGRLIKGGTIFALTGDLGGGKTCFTQGLALGLGIKRRILSPTFVVSKIFPINKKGFRNLYHLDFYRLKRAQIDKMALLEMLNDKKSIMATEWAEKVQTWLPVSRTIFLNFGYLDRNRRLIKMKTQSKALDKMLKKVYNKE